MNGPQHYRKAEELAAQLERERMSVDDTARLAAAAGVHATLALAAATALVARAGHTARPAEMDAWAPITDPKGATR
jgi:hypothetical protein